MSFTESELRTLVANAATLYERLTPTYLPLPEQNQTQVTARLEAWAKHAAKGDPVRFARRLALDGWSQEESRRMVSEVTLADDAPLPRWAQILDQGLQVKTDLDDLKDPDFTAANRFLIYDDPQPFEEVFAPFVYLARDALIGAVAPEALERLSSVAWAQIEHSLIEALSEVCGQTLLADFTLFRLPHVSRLTQLPPGSTAPRDLYDQFITDLLTGKLKDYFTTYPVIARMVGTITGFWIDAQREFLIRLHQDWPALEEKFSADQGSLKQITAIKASLSDRHNQGRAGMALRFANDTRLIYKPKPLGMDAAYSELIDWLNARAVGDPAYLPLRGLAVLDRQEYGWVAFVQHQPVLDEAGARRYYRRAGQTMALVYAVGGTDFHRDNLIVSGEYPMLVDLEMALGAHIRPFEGIEDEITLHAIDWMLTDSVLGSGLLTAWGSLPGGRSVDIAGLGGDTAQEITFRAPKWFNLNRDTITYQPGNHVSTKRENVLYLLDQTQNIGHPQPPYRFQEEIETGFRAAYRLIARERENLLAPDSPFARMGQYPARYILRATRLYGTILSRSLRPDVARNGVDRGVLVESLSRGMILTQNKHPLWPALRDEIEAILRGDVPIFTYLPIENTLRLEQGRIEGIFSEPGYTFASNRIGNLSEEDLEQQTGFIRGSLAVRFAGQTAEERPAVKFELPPDGVTPLIPSALIERALRIAADIDAASIRIGRSIEWVQPTFLPNANRYDMSLLSYSLYEGKGGIAVFLAALAKVTGERRWRDLALGAIHPMRLDVRHPEGSLMRRAGIGGMDGWGSFAYALAKIGAWLDDPAVVEDAYIAASTITPVRIAQDNRYDLLNGAAGSILGLLAVHHLRPDDELLDRARRCGDHLLQARTPGTDGLRAWVTLENTHLIGFLHGSAGIGYALLKLYEITGDSRYREAALEAVEFERRHFDPEAGDYPDLRPLSMVNGKHTFTANYCHGSPGIALARVGALAHLEQPPALETIEVGVRISAQPEMLNRFDFACCGSFGRIETLLTAGRRLNRPEWVTLANQRAAWISARAEARGHYQMTAELPPNLALLGFFQGLSGLGYGLLRLALPDTLPSILLLE